MEAITPQNHSENKTSEGDFFRRWTDSSGLGLFPGFPKLEAVFIAVELAILLSLTIFCVHYYNHFARLIDTRIEIGVIDNPSMIFAAPSQVSVGQAATPEALAERLRNALFVQGDGGSEVGTYKLFADRLEIHPGPASFFRRNQNWEGPVQLKFTEGHVASITSLDDQAALKNYLFEPELITSMFGEGRAKQRLVTYQDLPKVVVNAILATEDHRFFSHHGVNFLRIVAAANADLRANEPRQGGSTLTMQLARNVFLTPRRTIKRKLQEICLALLLETRLNKEQILEMYANEIYLGQQGSFSIYGMGEASEAYFNKDVGNLTLPEAALLAGLIRGPNLYSPYQYPERAVERRNFVLRRMVETDFIKPAEAEAAIATPLVVAKPSLDARQEPYFVDMMRMQLLAQLSERDLLSQGYRVYTTLDLDLQRAASESARIGIAEIDQQLKKPKGKKNEIPSQPDPPQIALVVLDPHTGDLKALIGGRNYGTSQLDHAVAKRQPGSSFKPFVYAAALNSAVDGSVPTITPATVLTDQPTAFQYGNQWDKPYQPKNYKQSYHGSVTVREALMLSLNVPTVQLAETVGYDKVRNLALSAGFNSQLRPTPSIALGAYEATPVEVAGAYTVFANDGQYVAPRCIVEVDDPSGRAIWTNPVSTRRVLDSRVSYLMVSLLQSVINSGTGAAVRARGFKLPVAGKTGTSRDGWFAGFTSNLLAVAWVGYDDNRELHLTGARSALPVWTEFMKRATTQPSYRNAQPFKMPEGIVTAAVTAINEPQSNLVAFNSSASIRTEIFIEGTEPGRTGTGSQSGILADVQGSLQSPRTTPPSAEEEPSAVSAILNQILEWQQVHAASTHSETESSDGQPIARPGDERTNTSTEETPTDQDSHVADQGGQPGQQDGQDRRANPGTKSYIKSFEGEGSNIQMELKPQPEP